MIERLPLEILRQPDERTCGPTCLHALYRYYGEAISLDRVIAEVPVLANGGTLAVFLACHALRRGYRATLFTYNLQMFDPTWFRPPKADLADKLKQQLQQKQDPALETSTRGYLDFLALGGTIRFEDLTPALIRKYLTRERPILTGLSATFLHRSRREIGHDGEPDDVRGVPTGHFVVLCGYYRETRHVLVADPLHPNPLGDSPVYAVGIERVLGAILLGMVTYDADLLILEPPSHGQGHKGR